MWFPNRSSTNWAVTLQKAARSLKFWIEEEDGLYFQSGENKGPEQLHGYREADLHQSLFWHTQIVGYLMRHIMSFMKKCAIFCRMLAFLACLMCFLLNQF